MNKIKEQIIELIEPYMEKEVKKGCILSYINIFNQVKDQQVFYEIIDNYFDYKNQREVYHLYEYGINKILNNRLLKGEIIGCYDITAVLKYIIDKGYYFIVNPNCFDVRGKGILDGEEYNDVYYGIIKNKPLSLYIEEENKDLLELLLKLKQGI